VAFGCKKGSLRYGSPSTRSSGVDRKHTAGRLSGLVETIRGSANPKSGDASREVHSHPQPCLECGARQGRRGGKDFNVQTGIIQFDEVR
jgi:hypothetical protein